jgi:16S rRNA (adenine1518-N6/adenine1519-N6)-dimethyltransferase
VSTAIIEKILPEQNWDTAVLMVQKEVGERLTAGAGNKQYGSFTLICGHYARFENLFSVGPGCFFPRPRVDSVVVKAVNLRAGALAPGLTGFIRASFSQRRKTILNNVSNALNIPKNTALKTFEQLGINPQLRPENLSFEQFKILYKYLSILVGETY